MADFVVGGDDFGGGEDGVEFGAEEGETAGVFEEEVHCVVHRDGGCVCGWEGVLVWGLGMLEGARVGGGCDAYLNRRSS